PIIKRAIELGGHIKTGLELFFDPDRKPTNLDLLQETQEIAREVGRPLATHEDARRIYNIK
ncbi:MAG: 3-keto-5-aminohexanoate cleavage protein, partial [Verrucomicrobia bacterium]|nr:3-keto-5-aminohexanoate cleavage protein [Verrucomicrobiota bacterium]